MKPGAQLVGRRKALTQHKRVFADNQQAAMKNLLALLLASACFQAQAADLLPCDKALRFMAAWFADPEVDNTKPAAELTKIGAGAGRSGTQLGDVVVETKLSVAPQTRCQGVVVRAWKLHFESFGVAAAEIDKTAPAFRHIDDVCTPALRRLPLQPPAEQA